MNKDIQTVIQAVFDGSPNAVLVVDYLGIIVLANDQIHEMFGYTNSELIGRSVETLVPSRFAKSHRDYRESYSNQPINDDIKRGDVLSGRKKDGNEIFVEINLKPVKVGRRVYVVASVTKLTSEDAVDRNMKKMIENVQDFAILFTDIDGNITNWNQGVKRIKGYNESEIIGKNLKIFFTEEDLEKNLDEKILDKAIRNGKTEDEGWRVRKDGSKIWAYVSITAIHDSMQHFIGFSQITRDLTQQKLADDLLLKQAEGLKVKNKELEHFAYIASHDLQEPLSTVVSMIDLIKEEDIESLNEDTLTYFNFMEDAVSRMQELVRGLLDYSRLGKNRKLLKKDIAKILDDVQKDLFSHIQSTNAVIEIGKMPEIKVYEVEIRLVFQNLISNALKFVEPGKPAHIKISAKDAGDYWKFSIKDNGIGIKEKHLDKVFVLFQRLNTGDKYKGTGIGLAHCSKVIEMHGGIIWVKSEFGTGSTFFFSIPKEIEEEVIN